ncbi:MAG: hypothetical protein DDT21_02320 [Syntrophomonadaceae bacterium]|nr:hypothetical protein [Bacillota bacterium]
MQIALDTNILIVLLRGKPEAPAQKVADILAECDRRGQLSISPYVWSELKLLLDERKLESFLIDNRILVDWEPMPEIWSTAAAAFRQYLENRRRSGSLYYCATCGTEVPVRCPECGKAQGFPRHILPDFLIGAHALHRANIFLTADLGIPRKYFPSLNILNPLEESIAPKEKPEH